MRKIERLGIWAMMWGVLLLFAILYARLQMPIRWYAEGAGMFLVALGGALVIVRTDD